MRSRSGPRNRAMASSSQYQMSLTASPRWRQYSSMRSFAFVRILSADDLAVIAANLHTEDVPGAEILLGGRRLPVRFQNGARGHLFILVSPQLPDHLVEIVRCPAAEPFFELVDIAVKDLLDVPCLFLFRHGSLLLQEGSGRGTGTGIPACSTVLHEEKDRRRQTPRGCRPAGHASAAPGQR